MRKIAFLLAILAIVNPLVSSGDSPKLTSEQREKLKEREALTSEVKALRKEGKLRQAVETVEKILKLECEVLGDSHEDVAKSFVWLISIQEELRDYSAMSKSWEQLAAIRTKTLGKDHWQTIDARLAREHSTVIAGLSAEERSRLAGAEKWAAQVILLYGQGKYEEAVPFAEKASDTVKEILGVKHPYYANSLNNRAELSRAMARYPEAHSLYLEATRIYKDAMGDQHPTYANNLSNLGMNYYDQGLLSKAEPLYLEASRIFRATKGESDPLYANTLNSLGSLYQKQGRYVDAETKYWAAARIIEAESGRLNSDYAITINGLATLYRRQGKYAQAEHLYREALRILNGTVGKKHPEYALTLMNLAGLFSMQGLYDKAETYHSEALTIFKGSLGEKHPRTARSMSNLALLYSRLGNFDQAERLCTQAAQIFKAIYGEKHPDYAASIDTLAGVHMAQSQYDKAELLYIEALRLTKDVSGEKHPDYATGLNNLAMLYERKKDFDAAEPLQLKASAIIKETLLEQHPVYGTSLNNRAVLNFKRGRYAEAEPLFRRALGIWQEHLEQASAIQSEADQLHHLGTARSYLDNFLALPDANADTLFASVFRWHGVVTTRQRFARLSANASPETRKVIEELLDVTRQLNRLTQNPPQSMPKDELAKQVKALDEQREQLQKNLAGQSKDFAAYQTHLKLSPADLQKSLPQGTALIDFLVHGDSISAFIVTKTAIRRVVLEAKGLDEELDPKNANGFLGELCLARTKPVIDKFHIAAKLRRQIWEPLEEHLTGITRVLICPDGPLCRLPFAALPGADPKKYLLEELAIVVVPVPQLLPGLLAVEAKKPAGAVSVLVVGDVDFDGDPAAGEPAKPALPVALTRSGNGGLSWIPLPHTKGEAEAIETLFGQLPGAKVKRLTRNEATESALEAELPKHRYLYLATHGFFEPPKFVQQFKGKQPLGDEKVLVPVLPPGLSSGIVCAGANKPTFQSSGILTASQIGELDLRGVELVVLSACETGLGELAGGEGVLGLQRAFQIAGTRSTVSTLWSVEDKPTAELMKRMYANRLEKGMSAADALREAQLWVLNNGDKVGVFDGKPMGSKRTPPKFWAAFTFAGDWR